ncbi:hypothetical protein BpHYR1_033029 [Brachionus plicatilis]|uniref:Uncharacterized protein n=1 Tax=Brachionus plicatilis TaxID=10195 RepID=A0A3M7P4Q9_BRAPC|nr:hypothetical protein BpHYR1_033029 [Brachionus plicatilis]
MNKHLTKKKKQNKGRFLQYLIVSIDHYHSLPREPVLKSFILRLYIQRSRAVIELNWSRQRERERKNASDFMARLYSIANGVSISPSPATRDYLENMTIRHSRAD